MGSDIPGVDDWDPWDPQKVAGVLAGYAGPWAVTAGWAIDLYHGRTTREHKDIEIAVPRQSFDDLRRYLEKGFDLFAAGGGEVVPLDEKSLRQKRQMWVCDRVTRKWRTDIFLEPGDTVTWISNRDPRVTMPYADLLRHSADAIPYHAPETVLFMKAKHARDKDEADLIATLPTLDARALAWLIEALGLAHPGHPWLERCRAAS